MQSLTANPARLVALVAGIAVLAGGMLVFTMTRHGGSSSSTASTPHLLHTSIGHRHAPVTHKASAPKHAMKTAAHAKPVTHRSAVAPSGLPWSVQDALARNPVVVVAVVSPKVPLDTQTLAEAKAAAKAGKAGFVQVNAYAQKQIGPFDSVVTVNSNPALLVMRGPKTVTIQVPSYVDHQSLVQAIDDARISKPAPTAAP